MLRAKMKKVQRKSKDGGDKSDKDKEDKIKQESPSSDYILDNGYGQPLNPNLPFSPDGNIQISTLHFIRDINY